MKPRPKRSSAPPLSKSGRRPVPKGKPRPRPAAPERIEVDSRDHRPPPIATHVASLDLLADSAVAIAQTVEQAVLNEGRRADRAIAYALRFRRDLALPDHRFISQSVFALFRWRGWMGPLRLERPEERLLLAWMLDSPHVHPVCRVWARRIGRDPARLIPVGDAPNWTARAEGLKRWVEGKPVVADPWRLFPDWLREHLPLPPGGSSPKLKYLELLHVLQQPAPLWVRAQVADEKALWNALRADGLKPWISRQVPRAAKIDVDADVYHLAAFERGELEIQDLASQAVGLVCDPDPGERWWDACAGAGGKALHLSALMNGKGTVVATDPHEGRLKETARRARRSPYRNLTTKPWDGKHVAGKSRSFDGVLVDAPCAAIGTWRRNPDARWTLQPDAIPRLAALQSQLLDAAAHGVRPGGVLVYSVCTLTPAETLGVIRPFLESHADFQLDPFPHPLSDSRTDGTLQIWPQDADTDAMFIARMVRTGAK